MIDARGRAFRAGSFAAAVAVAAILGSSRFHGEGRRGGLEPHQAAHARSAHARVACRVCHAGGGRPSGRVCLECHPLNKAGEDRPRVVKRFAADRENSVSRTVLLVKRGRIHGAHVAGAHAMDCTDCHNRTGHAFDPPSRSLDRVLSEDTLSPSLPFIKRAGLELLLGRYAGRAEAFARIRAGLARFYRERDPETYEKRRAEIGGAAEILAGIYQREWGDYPDNLGHTRFPGCFRCHDGRHTSASGATIPGGCQTCHETLGDLAALSD